MKFKKFCLILLLILTCFDITLARGQEVGQRIKMLNSTVDQFIGANPPNKSSIKSIKRKYRKSLDMNPANARKLRSKYNDDLKRMALYREQQISKIEESLSSSFNGLIKGTDYSRLNLSKGFLGFSFLNFDKIKSTTKDGLRERNLKNSVVKLNGPKFIKEYQGFSKRIKKIEDFDFKVLNYNILAETKKIEQANLVVYMDLRFVNLKGLREQVKIRGLLNVKFKSKNPELISFKLSDGVYSELLRKPSFENRTSKVSGVAQYKRLEAIRRGGYAISLSDINNDSFPDLFLGNWGDAQAFKSNKGKSFVEMKDVVPKGLKLVKSIGFTDSDKDGDKDLFVARFSDKNALMVLENKNGKFLSQTKELQAGKRYNAMPSALGDFNNDGMTDIYVGFPGAVDFSAGYFRQDSNFSVQGIFKNKGNLSFQANSMRLSKGKADLFPHAGLAVDYDLDGDTDLVVVDDRTNGNAVYRNDGTGKFKRVDDFLGLNSKGYGMGVEVADLDNDGDLDIIFSNATFHAIHRSFRNLNSELSKTHFDGLRVFINESGSYKLLDNRKAGLSFSGNGAGSISVLDYNNDGYQDIYLVNGLWSGSDKAWDLQSLFAQTLIGEFGNMPTFESSGSSQSNFMKLLQETRRTQDKTAQSPSFGGYERNRLYRNNGDGTYSEVGFLENVDSLSDGYVAVAADMNNDGRMDLILRNCDYGTELYKYPSLEVFSNSHRNDNSIQLKLSSSTSNPESIGATIKVDGMLKTVTSLNGAAQGDGKVHFGLGENKKIKSLEVKWPSGKITRRHGLEKGIYSIDEPLSSVVSNN